MKQETTPTPGAAHKGRFAPITIGIALMTLLLGLTALTALPQATVPTENATVETPDPAIVQTARQFLLLIDQGR